MFNAMNLIYYKDKICKIWIGLKPIVILFTPDEVEVILSSNTLTDKSSEYRFLTPWLGGGLVTSSKIKWKTRRKILTPAFHFRILDDFAPVINEQSTVLINKLRTMIDNSKCDDQPIDIVPIITLCTLDVICETAMGIKVGCQANSNLEYVQALHDISGIFLIRLMRPWLWPNWAFNCSSHGKQFNSSLKKMKAFTMKVICERKQEWIEHIHRNDNNEDIQSKSLDAIKESNFFNGKKRLAFLDLLLHQHLVANNLTLEDLREEVDTFMFAGHDTTAQAISWTLYMLGLHQDIQSKVREEVDSVMDSHLDDNDFSIEDLKQLKYLECVLKEVQRLYPTAPFIGRQLSEDTIINGYLIPKGTSCGIFTYILHRDPIQFPNPEQFIPERFLPENCVGRHPYCYIPFSAGPRNCIGQKFAFLEQKIVVSKIVRNFHIQTIDQRDKLFIVGEMVLRTRNGLKLIIKQRNRDIVRKTFTNSTDYLSSKSL
ncbi:cytochrome P450 4c3-like [Oppia nitens]|uniref:cytochrome P450 4c3-like n=1 Tax=Oppia nitens TaxID=1686743 RepID=UPI0023DC4AF8|nr:cytochrome P450 4c3-like [Oppia nitens]